MNLDSFSKIITYLKQDKKRIYILAFAAVALVLIFISYADNTKESDENITLQNYKLDMENELSKLCSSIEGAGKCVVNVTFAEGERLEYRGSNVAASYPPKVLGVAVICDGANRESVRRDITECITSLFDIGSNRVSVLKLK